jgi:hypothetical protein
MNTNEYCFNAGMDFDIEVSRPLRVIASMIRLPLQAADSLGRLNKALAKAGTSVRTKPQPPRQSIESFLRTGFEMPELAANIGHRPPKLADLRQTV